MRIPKDIRRDACLCGARTEAAGGRCCKCRYRARWRRRKFINDDI
ncbi:MAG: hypothetical protein ACRDP6_36695 [Actinoallomurus sp.]